VLWCKTRTGKAIPVDAQPRTDGTGNIQLVNHGSHLAALVGAAGSGEYVAHFVTCPEANGHRKERRR